MRRFLIALNSTIAVFFLAAFAYTFIGEAHLLSVAREFAADKTVDYARPLVELAEKATRTVAISSLLSKSQKSAIANEFREYHSNPPAYISGIAAKVPHEKFELPENALIKKLHGWKNQIRDYYNKVLDRILKDLRIFSGTNLLAGCVACFLAFLAKEDETRILVWLSGALLAATCISIFSFIDTFSFYQYLFNSHMGWSYPATVFLVYLYIIARLHKCRAAYSERTLQNKSDSQ